jgi:hypothetical protein
MINSFFMKGVRVTRPLRVKHIEKDVPDHRIGKRIQAGIGIAASLVGLVAYLYLLGGLVIWLRFNAAQLPADDAIGALDSKRMLATGIKALIFEIVLLAGLLGIAWAAWYLARVFSSGLGKTKKATLSPKRTRHSPEALAVILLAFGLGISIAAASRNFGQLSELWPAIIGGVAGFASALLDDSEAATDRLTMWPVLLVLSTALGALAIFFLSAPVGIAVLALTGLALFSAKRSELFSVDDPARLVPVVLAVGGCLSIVAASYIATPPVALDRVSVQTANGHTLVGGYIGRSSNGLILATCHFDKSNPTVSDSVRLRVVSTPDGHPVFLGGKPYTFDYGKNPSLFDFAKHFIGGDPIGELVRTYSIDPRGSNLACGLGHSFGLGRIVRNTSDGTAREKLQLYGAGTLVLDGDDVEEREKTVDGRSSSWLRIAGARPIREDLAHGGSARIAATLAFKLDDGPESRRTLHMTLREAPASSATAQDLGERGS